MQNGTISRVGRWNESSDGTWNLFLWPRWRHNPITNEFHCIWYVNNQKMATTKKTTQSFNGIS